MSEYFMIYVITYMYTTCHMKGQRSGVTKTEGGNSWNVRLVMETMKIYVYIDITRRLLYPRPPKGGTYVFN